MNSVFRYIGDTFLNKRLDFRVRLYNVLAMSGVPLGLMMAASCVYTNAGIGNIIINLMIATGSFLLLYYSYKSGKYQQCYTLSIVIMFLILFPALFFTAGGYHSGMPSFFVFAVLFTAFMLEGKKVFVIAAIELALYIGICLIAYFYPETVRSFPSEQNVMSDIIVGFVTVSIWLGITMFLHFRIYNQQQRELEAAREEALNLSQAKSNFLANMSHEIRTPINVMLGMNEMILREIDSEQVKGYGQNIQNAGKTLLLLINNILDVSKIESGKLAVTLERYQTADLIDEISVIGTDQASRYGLAFHAHADDTLPNALIGDAIHIRQVVVNFLSNAAKYTKEGGVTMSAAQKPGDKPDEILLCISVSDTGIGIKDEKLSLLFDAFIRADMPSNRYIEGTGLGLAIAKELTELMGGRIYVESEWGKGSVFTIELPQKVHDKTPLNKRIPSDTEKKNATDSFIAPGGSILVVDDNLENLQVVKSLLSRTMMRVDAANSGEECLVLTQSNRYNVILMDYMMPGMDGAETLRHLREIPGFDTPVIALTANVVAGVKEKLLDAGFSAYLSKPVTWKDLEDAVRSLLPPELVTLHAARSGDLLTGEARDNLARELTSYDVTLTDGLRYLSGDILQYRKIAAFFIENYEPGKRQVAELAAANDWQNLKFAVHSLKSKARAVGANSLSDTAARLEKQCGDGNGAYIAVTLPVLYYEWERARDGLTAFTLRLGAFIPEIPAGKDATESIDSLLLLLRHNRQPDALAALGRMIATECSPGMTDRLREVWQKVDDIELREAERLLTRMREDGLDGK